MIDKKTQRTARRCALVACAAILETSVPGAAVAASGFNLHGSVPGGPGSASASGSLSFATAHRFAWHAVVRDICPADAKGAQLQFVVLHVDGSQSIKQNVVSDEDGCSGVSVQGSGTFTDKKRIRSVRVVLYSTQHRQPWITVDLSRSIVNPRT